MRATRISKSLIAQFYLEYATHWLSIEEMAKFYEMTKEDCISIVTLGKKYHNEIIEGLKGGVKTKCPFY